MYAFVDAHRHEYGVEPICRVLEIAPSGYYAAKQEECDPSRRSPRRQRDAVLREKIRTTHAAHFGGYGVRKMWHQVRHDGETVPRCTVERLMGAEGLQGVVRGARFRTTRPAEDPAPQAADLVQRQFTASRPQPDLGGRFHVRSDLAGVRVRRVRDRRVLAPHRGLAGPAHDGRRPGA